MGRGKKKMSDNDMEIGEFKGKVMTHLKYLKSSQEKQLEKIDVLEDKLNKYVKDDSVRRWMIRGLITWNGVMTSILIKFFTKGGGG